MNRTRCRLECLEFLKVWLAEASSCPRAASEPALSQLHVEWRPRLEIPLAEMLRMVRMSCAVYFDVPLLLPPRIDAAANMLPNICDKLHPKSIHTKQPQKTADCFWH